MLELKSPPLTLTLGHGSCLLFVWGGWQIERDQSTKLHMKISQNKNFFKLMVILKIGALRYTRCVRETRNQM